MKTREPASARWGEIVREQESSDLSVAEFCRRRDLAAPTFYAARARLRSSASAPFVELKIQDPADAGARELELILPGGYRIRVPRGFDGPTLRQLLVVLEPPEAGA